MIDVLRDLEEIWTQNSMVIGTDRTSTVRAMMLCVRLGEEFDTKIVNSKGKSCASISVAPETRGLGNWEVSVRGKVRFELIVCKDGSLFEAIHAFADL
jgi:hypothetical protein